MNVRLATSAIVIGLLMTGCGKSGGNASAATTEGSDAVMTDALDERAKEIEARADQSVKQVEADAAADLKALQAEASQSVQAESEVKQGTN